MARSRLFAVAAALAAGVAGCAHCDTCDDMPVPCTGPGCGAALRPGGPAMLGPSPGPFSLSPVTAPGAATTSAPEFTPPPVPDVPADPPTPPPAPDAPQRP